MKAFIASPPTTVKGGFHPEAVALVAILTMHAWLVLPLVRSQDNRFDAIHAYLPMARTFLERGLSFLADERSIHAPILSWLWPALLGAQLETVVAVHVALSFATLLMVWRAGTLLHSRAAGLIAAAVFALSPTLRPHLVSPITEPPYLFCCAVWLWSVAEATRIPRLRWILLGAAALGVACLFRATMFTALWLIAAGGAFAWWRARGVAQRTPRRVVACYLLATVPALLLIAKNLVVFHFGFYTTGGGNALYLGVNPLTGGIDPGYLALSFDVGAIARDQSHLTLEAERLLGGVAKLIYAEKGAGFLLELTARKMAAFFLVTTAEPDVLLLRSWRIATLVLAMLGLLAARNRRLAWAVFGMLAFLCAMHVPALYVHRYSVGALDLWLTVAAGAGVAVLLEMPRPVLAIARVASLIAVACGAGWLAWRDLGRPMPDVFAVGRLTAWTSAASTTLGPAKAEALFTMDARQGYRDYNNHVLVMDARHAGASWDAGCEAVTFAYKGVGEMEFTPEMTLRRHVGEDWHRYQLGTLPMHLRPAGTLRVRWACATPLEIRSLQLVAALGAIDYRERLLHERPLLPVER